MTKVRDILSKGAAAKQAQRGKDMGKKDKNFAKVAAKSGEEKGKNVAGAIFQKLQSKGKS